jgi:dCMP deaminase
MDKWVRRYLNLAREVSTWSKDPRSQVGAVAVKNRSVVSQGMNGLPIGVEDTPERLNDRELKNKLIVHAETNCVVSAARNGVSLLGADLYVYGIPVCHECSKLVIQSGIKCVHMLHRPVDPRWAESFELTKMMFAEAGVEWHCHENT